MNVRLLTLHTVLLLSCCIALNAQDTYYVDQQNGSSSNNGLSETNAFDDFDDALDEVQPGDTIFIMGEYTNDSFDENYTYSGNINDPHIWHQENTIRINNINGTFGNYITIKGHPNHPAVIRGDGANIFRVTNSSYLKIEDLELYGIVEDIPLSTALSLQFLYRNNGSTNTLHRVPPGTTTQQVEDNYSSSGSLPALSNVSRPSYTDTRGFYFSNNIHHVEFRNNVVHHTPGNGFRVQGCDYIIIENNEVHNCSRKSYSGTHGLVVTNATNIDTNDNHKIFIRKNRIHHNYNEIYSWAPTKTFITPRIDEGKGISLQRNDLANGWEHGRILVENNLTYWNGFSGLHSNTGIRIDFVNNTAYMNSYTNSVTYASETQTGKNIGMSAQGGDDNSFINNVIFIDNAWNGFPISIANETNTVVANNLIFGINGSITQDSDVTAIATNIIVGNPLFIDAGSYNASSYDFNILETSPAISEADASLAPTDDFFGNLRDANPDLGAIEYNASLSAEEFQISTINVYPNPFKDQITITFNGRIEDDVTLYNVLGQQQSFTMKLHTNSVSLGLNHLTSGIYILKVGATTKKIVKTN